MTCGVYLLRFKNTDMVYVGISENIERRLNSHKHSFKERTAPKKLQNAFLQYGEPNLEVLCECDRSELAVLEKEAIQIFNSIEYGFNSRDGGSCGASVSLSGEGNGRSKYSNKQIEQAFQLLINTTLTQKQIADTVGISKEAVSHISAGTGHTWLNKKFPTEYQNLLSNKRSVKHIFIPINIIDKVTNNIYNVNSYEEIQKLTGCAYSTAVCFVSGTRECIFNRWILEVPARAKNSKKEKYLLKHVYTNKTEEVYSKLAFFNSNGLTNRKKFSEFLKSGQIGSTYQDWQLISICHNDGSAHFTAYDI